MAELDRDTLFRKMRSKPENKVCGRCLQAQKVGSGRLSAFARFLTAVLFGGICVFAIAGLL